MVKIMLLYILIFCSKILENAIATLRIIVVANGKKIIGAILQGIVAIIWVCVTGVVVVDILKDPFKILAFALGSVIGSYLGGVLEEKIALGNKLLLIIIDNKNEIKITNKIREKGLAVTTTLGKGMDNNKSILFILIPRKQVNLIIKIVKSIDVNALIISENALNIYGGFLKEKNIS